MIRDGVDQSIWMTIKKTNKARLCCQVQKALRFREGVSSFFLSGIRAMRFILQQMWIFPGLTYEAMPVEREEIWRKWQNFIWLSKHNNEAKRQKKREDGKWLSLYEGLFTRQSRMNCSENDLAFVSFA
jgi:hypothetical protein